MACAHACGMTHHVHEMQQTHTHTHTRTCTHAHTRTHTHTRTRTRTHTHFAATLTTPALFRPKLLLMANSERLGVQLDARDVLATPTMRCMGMLAGK